MATKTEAEKEIDSLKADLHTLREDIAKLTEAFKRQGTEQAKARYQQAKATAEDYGEQARKVADDVGHRIEERPLTSVLSAFGIGFIVGRLLDR